MSETDVQDESIFVDWWRLPDVIPAPLTCSYDPATREYLGLAQADPSPLEPGIWLIPGGAAVIDPPARIGGFAHVLSADGREWEQVKDLRGQVVYRKDSGESVTVTALGLLDSAFTLQAPTTPIDTWQADGWAPDPVALAEHNALRKVLLGNQAGQQIATLQRAVDLDMATEIERQALEAWSRYSVLLNRTDTTAIAVAWPQSPDPSGAAAWLNSQAFDDTY
ncbi:tail fiber assembly protein [Pseudomonas syringae]|nr:tail fiber assembly protein [Pseudomonas syringae]MBD8802304.1 tail fiber assembly protein [Pseudomonas syringae]MBD8812871.1 tail fiber assembly protein [Pseudomonas syringae]